MKVLTKSKIKKEAHKIWSLVVRTRDGFKCQQCGKIDKHNHAHHIVSKGVSNPDGQTNHINGVTLCYREHIFGIKSDPDKYIQWRDEWLKARGLEFLSLKAMFCKPLKWSIDDYLDRINMLKSILKEL